MKLFSYLYDKTLLWSGHRHAPYYLASVSFAESSFFPIPPDVMLVSMGLAAPQRAWYYAFIATLFSVLGGALGYVIGLYGMELIEPYLVSSYASGYYQIAHWFEQHGVWIVILAGFTPFPYKLFTIAAGAMHMAFLPFLFGSLIGRGLRFFLVSAILYFMGARIETRLRHYIDVIGWSTILIFIIIYFLIQWMP
ncbi:YqaA family protein [Legionella nagasakiensis]|uniref:YqaA family protein n=1 Tax=Legionella nagasakiensis TaxID=535290 RepID=UPI0010546291|nr:YqaA family protein [Legionella nagasakiensis]